MIFVDTGAWYAAIVPTDPNHNLAAAFWPPTANRFDEDYIVMNLTPPRSRRSTARFSSVNISSQTTSQISSIVGRRLRPRGKSSGDYADKIVVLPIAQQSVIEQLGITTAFAFINTSGSSSGQHRPLELKRRQII